MRIKTVARSGKGRKAFEPVFSGLKWDAAFFRSSDCIVG